MNAILCDSWVEREDRLLHQCRRLTADPSQKCWQHRAAAAPVPEDPQPQNANEANQ